MNLDGLKEGVASVADKIPGTAAAGRVARWLGVALGIYLLLAVVVGIYWSFMPSLFDVVAQHDRGEWAEGLAEFDLQVHQ